MLLTYVNHFLSDKKKDSKTVTLKWPAVVFNILDQAEWDGGVWGGTEGQEDKVALRLNKCG